MKLEVSILHTRAMVSTRFLNYGIFSTSSKILKNIKNMAVGRQVKQENSYGNNQLPSETKKTSHSYQVSYDLRSYERNLSNCV